METPLKKIPLVPIGQATYGRQILFKLLIDQVQTKLSTVTPLRKYEASIAGIVFGNCSTKTNVQKVCF